MKQYLLPHDGQFYKANLHCHTNYSDGVLSPQQVKDLYTSLGYSVVAFTDHDLLIAHDELTDESFLALHGFEVEVNEEKDTDFNHLKVCHFCCIALDPENMVQPCWHRSEYLFANAPSHRSEVQFDPNRPDYVRHYDGTSVSHMMDAIRKEGFFVTYNHPSWSMEDYGDYMGYHGMNAFEIMNGTCIAMGYDDYNPRVYDDLLRSGKKLYCIGADDNHNKDNPNSRMYDAGWAFTMIKAEALDYRSITSALEQGAFYASEGPAIHELWLEEDTVHIRCSPADRINCNYGMRKAETVLAEDTPVTEASFTVPKDCGYFRITVVDEAGRHACTNAYFTEDYYS